MSTIIALVGWSNLTTLIAIVGLLLSLFNTFQNFQKERRQEERRQPRIITSFINGYFQNHSGEEGRIYALQLKLKNPSDTNNSVSEAELAISYKREGQPLTRVRFRANRNEDRKFASTECAPMHLPVSIQGHSTISGWFYFFIPDYVSQDSFIDSYEVVIEDTHGKVTELSVGLVVEKTGDVDI